MTFLPTTKQGLLALLLLVMMTTSGCLGSAKPIAGPEAAMRADELFAIVGKNRLREVIKPFPDDSEATRKRYHVLHYADQKFPVRFFATPRGIVVELLVSPVPPRAVFGALLLEADGAALYLDMNDLRRAHPGAADVEPFARAAWPKIRHLVTWVNQDGQPGYLRPRDLDAVISIYIALRDAGMEPTTTYPLTEEN